MTRWVYPPCPRQSCVSGVDVFVVAPAPFCVVLLCFLLAKRKSGREICESSLFCLVFVCVCLDLPWIVEPRCFIMFAFYLPASLIVRTEPQSEIGRNRGKKNRFVEFLEFPQLDWGSIWFTHRNPFFLSEPVVFRRVHGLESYSRTSGESNHHRQSVSDTRVPRYQAVCQRHKSSAIPTQPRGRLSLPTETHLVSVFWTVSTNVNVGSSLRERNVCKCVTVRRPGRVGDRRNAKRSPFVFVLVWVYFEHERFESGFRDLTLCVKVLWLQIILWVEGSCRPTTRTWNVDATRFAN